MNVWPKQKEFGRQYRQLKRKCKSDRNIFQIQHTSQTKLKTWIRRSNLTNIHSIRKISSTSISAMTNTTTTTNSWAGRSWQTPIQNMEATGVGDLDPHCEQTSYGWDDFQVPPAIPPITTTTCHRRRHHHQLPPSSPLITAITTTIMCTIRFVLEGFTFEIIWITIIKSKSKQSTTRIPKKQTWPQFKLPNIAKKEKKGSQKRNQSDRAFGVSPVLAPVLALLWLFSFSVFFCYSSSCRFLPPRVNLPLGLAKVDICFFSPGLLFCFLSCFYSFIHTFIHIFFTCLSDWNQTVPHLWWFLEQAHFWLI